MAKGLTKYQLTVLSYIGLIGAQNILSIQEKTGLNYATTHRSIKTLEESNLVWLIEKGSRGPKSAQYYGLTPYGLVELYLRGKKMDLDLIIQNWDEFTPRMIANHKKMEKQIPLKTILESRYPYLVHPYQSNEPINWRENLLTIHRNILDTILLDTLKTHQLDTLTDIINNDAKYRKVWKHWFSIQTALYKWLKETNQKIKS